MDLLAQLFASTPGPDADFWYGPVGTMTSSGLKVDPDGAKKISAWYRGRDLLATSLAMLPLPLLEKLPDNKGSEPATSHPLYDVLHRKPNATDDAFRWKRQQMYDLIDYGNGFNWITVGRSWALERIDPTLVTVEKQRKRVLFHVRDAKTGQTTIHSNADIFHLEGAEGKGILERARESLGLTLVTEQYASRIFSKGFLNGGIIKVPGQMTPESARAMAQSFVTSMGEWHMPRVLPQGAEMSPDQGALTPENAQMLLSRKFSINEIARWLGLPPHMLADLDRATFSNIEHQGQEFVTYSLGSWLSLFEFAINDQLVFQPKRFYAQFTRDALVRGDIAARWQAYTAAVTTGTFTRNEIREMEDRNPLPGLDKPLDPAHLTGKQPKAKGPTSVSEKAEAEDEVIAVKSRAIVLGAVTRLLRKEITAVQKFAVRNASNMDAFGVEVSKFYIQHVATVADTLQMSEKAAGEYCKSQEAQALHEWVSAVRLWGTEDYAAGLAGLALEAA
jgi:HK97 family phage portal protein